MIVTLTPHTDMLPVPRVELTISEMGQFDGGGAGSTGAPLDGGSASSVGAPVDGGPAAITTVDVPAGTDRVTVWRRVNGELTAVQGAKSRTYSGPFGVTDFATPPGVESTFEVECFEGGESIARLTVGTLVMPWALAYDEVLVQHPLNPRLNAVLRNMAGSWPQIERQAPGEDIYVDGQDLATFVGAGPLRGIESVAIDFEARDRETAARVYAMFGTRDAPQLPVWLIRTPNPGLLPPVFYGRVQRLTEVGVTVGRRNTTSSKSRFRASLRQTKQPAPSIIIPAVRYSDLAAALGGTYSGIAAALPLYSEWGTAWEYSGAAG